MALVMIVTRDVADRFRGFLSSVMLEVAPCTYVSPRMSKGVRERVWQVMADWHTVEPQGSIVMIFRNLEATGGVGLAYLGTPTKTLLEVDGMWVARAGG
ncbi:MAG: type I-E CRISPR-associated endoribonuclease Cas2e [Pseudomonadota bacterium]|jgi:CRISPR-associated protein Cas2